MWSNDEIDDRCFIEGIDSLTRQDIAIDERMLKYGNDDKTIPVLVKRTVAGMAKIMITEEEFLRDVQYLIEKGFILV
ncbi:MAG: hypothetical protein QXW37_06180 [Candidatus Nitrosotenuis sp.]